MGCYPHQFSHRSRLFFDHVCEGLLKTKMLKGFSFVKRRIKVSPNWQSDVGVPSMNTHSVNNLHSQTQIQTFTLTLTLTFAHTHARIQSGAERDRQREKRSSGARAKRKRARKKASGTQTQTNNWKPYICRQMCVPALLSYDERESPVCRVGARAVRADAGIVEGCRS